MAIFNIANESLTNIATVFSNRALKVAQAYSYFAVPSASATGVVLSTSGILHAINFQNTATAACMFWIFDCAGPTAGAIGVSASAVARYDLTSIPKHTDIYNCIINGGLTYRLSGTEGTDGILITYSAAT